MQLTDSTQLQLTSQRISHSSLMRGGGPRFGPNAMSVVTDKALCNGDSRFLSFEIEDVQDCKDLCNACELKTRCLVNISFEDHPFIAGGTTGYDRLLRRWQRVEHEKENNFREFLEAFSGDLRKA